MIQYLSPRAMEVLVVQIRIKDLHVRVINAYGPQECDSQERKSLFWARLQTEVTDAAEANCAVFLQMDGNLRCGEDTANYSALGYPRLLHTGE